MFEFIKKRIEDFKESRKSQKYFNMGYDARKFKKPFESDPFHKNTFESRHWRLGWRVADCVFDETDTKDL